MRRGATSYSDNYFRVLGVQPRRLGVGLHWTKAEFPAFDAVVVLTYDFWNNILGGDRSLLDGNVLINGVDFTG